MHPAMAKALSKGDCKTTVALAVGIQPRTEGAVISYCEHTSSIFFIFSGIRNAVCETVLDKCTVINFERDTRKGILISEINLAEL